MDRDPRTRFPLPAAAGIPVALALSSAVSLYLPLSVPWFRLPLYAIALVLAGSAFPLLSARDTFHEKFTGFFLLALSVGLAFGLALSGFRIQTKAAEGTGIPPTRITSYQARLLDDSRPSKGGLVICPVLVTQAKGDSLSAQANFKAVVLIQDRKSRLDNGTTLSVSGRFRKTEDGSYLSFVTGSDLRELPSGGGLVRFRSAARAALIARMDSLPSQSGGFFKALFLGVKDDLDTEFSDAFKASGCLHVLALSGQHLSILSAMIVFFLVPFTGKKAAFAIGLAFIGAYVFTVGPQPSIMRAAVMYFIFSVAFLLDRQTRPLSCLAWAFLAMAALDPESTGSLSFILSYMAIYGLVSFTEVPSRWLRKYLPEPLSNALGASLACQFATLPVAIFSFGLFYPGSLVATMASSPLVPVYVWTGMAATAATFLPPVLNPFPFLLDLEYRAFFAAIRTGTVIPPVLLTATWAKLAFSAAALFILLSVYAIPYWRFLRRNHSWTDPITIPPPT